MPIAGSDEWASVLAYWCTLKACLLQCDAFMCFISLCIPGQQHAQGCLKLAYNMLALSRLCSLCSQPVS
jgi:hypothetical protein